MIAEPDEIERAFAAVGPWQTRFLIGGRAYGGDQASQEDGRVDEFFRLVGAPGSVLELGSFEGAHSALLVAAPSVERVVSLEGREENVRRARSRSSCSDCRTACRSSRSTSRTPTSPRSAASTPRSARGCSTT